MSKQQYVISDPANIIYQQFQSAINETPSVVWLQQMEKAYIKAYKLVPNHGPDEYYARLYCRHRNPISPLQTVEEYNPQYFDPDYGTGPYWDDTLYYNRNCHSDMTTIHQQTTRMIWRLKTTIEFQPKKEESLS